MATTPHIWAVDISGWIDAKPARQVEQLADELLGAGTEASKKVQAYYRVPDKIRALAGQLLPRILYCSQGLAQWGSLVFSKTPEGRPFLAHPKFPLDYNVTHDGDWVALASCSSVEGRKVGVDVMRIALPRYEQSVASFLNVMEMALTKSELDWIAQVGVGEPQKPYVPEGRMLSRHEQKAPRAPLPPGDQEALERLFDLWTYKEALTKALGIGLGFDFARIELALWKAECDPEHVRATRRASSLLTLSDKPENRFEFHEVQLPPGAVSNSGNDDPHTSCQLVIAHGPLDPQPETHLRPALSAQAAQEANMLTIWDMDRLVTDARKLRVV